MELDVERSSAEAAAAELTAATGIASVILLDTNALIWLDQGHARTRGLLAGSGPLYVSPASLLELQFLIEVGRIRLRGGTLERFAADDRWLVDDPPAAAWFNQAVEYSWTRDPFDRLLVAHARIRGWRLATADTALLKRLKPAARLEV